MRNSSKRFASVFFLSVLIANGGAEPFQFAIAEELTVDESDTENENIKRNELDNYSAEDIQDTPEKTTNENNLDGDTTSFLETGDGKMSSEDVTDVPREAANEISGDSEVSHDTYWRIDSNTGVLYLSSTKQDDGYAMINESTLGIDSGTLRNPWYNKRLGISKVIIEDDIYPTSTRSYFHDMINLVEIQGIEKLHMDYVTNTRSMFNGCEKLERLDVSSFNMQNVENPSGMFAYCRSLIDLDMGSWNTEKFTDVNNMFKSCVNLRSLGLQGWNLSNTKFMNYMFNDCSSLSNLNTDGWTVKTVENMQFMFNNCGNLPYVNTAGWDISNATDVQFMFSGCKAINNIDTSSWDTSNIINAQYMFNECRALGSLDTANWEFPNIETAKRMFSSAVKLQNLDVSKWNMQNCVDLDAAFNNCNSVQSLDVSLWDTSNIQNLHAVFSGCTKITELDVSNWDVSKVADFGALFENCTNLESLDISSWVGESATDTHKMFINCKKMTEIDASKIDMCKVTNGIDMFKGCTGLYILKTPENENGANMGQMPLDMYKDNEQRDLYLKNETIPYNAELYRGYTVKLNLNEGEYNGENSPLSYIKLYNKPISLSEIMPTRDGFVFKNWVDADGNIYDEYNNNQSIELMALWEEDIKVPVIETGANEITGSIAIIFGLFLTAWWIRLRDCLKE